MAPTYGVNMIKNIEAKIEKLKENKKIIIEKMQKLDKENKQCLADLNAIDGAMQVCEQLMGEAKDE
tara:strand:- start:134 stop:331 length:198 start_codon:yes stop_codon:yes gene_type:complete